MNVLTKTRERLRLTVQIAFTALTNGYVNGFVQGKIYQGSSKKICVPGLNCYSCPGALGSCPIGSLQAVLTGQEYRFSFYVIGILMAFGAFFGRFICGWLCPFGLVQDLLYKIPLFRKLHRVPGERILAKLKYAVLAFLVILLPLLLRNPAGIGTPWFCKVLCPSGTLLGGIPLLIANPVLRSAAGFLFSWKMVILLILLVLSIKIYRPFCRYLCPLGAIYGCFHPVSIYRYEVDQEKCTKCGACQKQCGLDIPVYEKPNSPECIRCGKCKSSCPHGAIHSGICRTKGKKPQENKNEEGSAV